MLITVRAVKKLFIEHVSFPTVPKRTFGNQVETSRNSSLQDIGRKTGMLQPLTVEEKKMPMEANLKNQIKSTKSTVSRTFRSRCSLRKGGDAQEVQERVVRAGSAIPGAQPPFAGILDFYPVYGLLRQKRTTRADGKPLQHHHRSL